MGTVRVTLRLSSADVLSTPLEVSCVSELSADSGAIQRVKVLGTGIGNHAQAIHKANQSSDRSYMYVKNLSSVFEEFVYVYEQTDDTVVAKLGGGEFCFVPVDPSANLFVYGTKVDQLVEFGTFGLDSSAVRFG